jgi:hypothetical protein
MSYVHNPSRQLRSHLGLLVSTGALALLLLGPKVTGKTGWWYAAEHQGCMVRIGKSGASTRDEGRKDARRRWGQPASKPINSTEPSVVASEVARCRKAA